MLAGRPDRRDTHAVRHDACTQKRGLQDSIYLVLAGRRQSCAILTHDVETKAGRDFCERLMDMNNSYGFKSSFRSSPRCDTTSQLRFSSAFATGGSGKVHGSEPRRSSLQNKEQFLRRAVQINAYARQFESRGFRAGAMYRQQDWFDALDFSYDMSVPNVAHLEPQRGGCCTVTPYFIGKIVELPLTTIQDYSLFPYSAIIRLSCGKRRLS